MLCFKCKREEFETREVKVHQEFRGEHFDVVTAVSVCVECGWETLGKGQVDNLRNQTADEYRRRHGLLTSAEIAGRRAVLDMSQQAFANFIGVGIASVKRWENGLVQEPVFDRLIRQKCDSNIFPFTLPEGVALGAMGIFIEVGQGEFSIISNLSDEIPNYSAQPVWIKSNVSRFTSRVAGDEQIAVFSQKWRKEHSNAFETEFNSCQ